MFKHTKIVATLGPSCKDINALKEMVIAGMDVARLNFSHGTHEEHRELFNNIREIERQTSMPVAIMQDLQGPKIRIGVMPPEGVELAEGQIIVFNTGVINFADEEIPIDFLELHSFVKSGERLLVNDGRIETKIIKVEGRKIYAEVVEGGRVISHHGINLPDSELRVAAITEKDKEDLKLAVQLGVEFVAVSFVNKAQDILDAKYLIKEYEEALGVQSGQPSIRLVAKIERRDAVKNIKEIIEAADVIMVARGDLGIEVSAAEVPLIQKRLIDEANAAAKPVIVATQMLDSMREHRRPTRAEVSDVANAVIDHADALMLSNETAAGKYPALAVQTMAEIIHATERSSYDDVAASFNYKKGMPVDEALSDLSKILAEEVRAKLILAASISGESGRLISHVRPSLPILVATSSERVQRQLNLSWGVKSFILPQSHSIEELVDRSINYIKQNKLAKDGERMIVVAGEPVGQAGHMNLVEVREI